MQIVPACADHLAAWGEMRFALWPWDSPAEHAAAAKADYLSGSPDRAAFIVRDDAGSPVAFAEAALRRDYVEGCNTSPVAFLEGIYVAPAARLQGLARQLSDTVAAWGRARGANEFASNALIDNTASHAFHAALGFAETERVVFFRKEL